MYEIMQKQDNRCLINLILSYPSSAVVQSSASKILKERDISINELCDIIHSIGKERVGVHSTQLKLDFPEKSVDANSLQLELSFKES